MIVHWKLSIGYPTAVRRGTIEIDDQELEGLTEEEKQLSIEIAVNEDIQQYIDWSYEIEGE